MVYEMLINKSPRLGIWCEFINSLLLLFVPLWASSQVINPLWHFCKRAIEGHGSKEQPAVGRQQGNEDIDVVMQFLRAQNILCNLVCWSSIRFRIWLDRQKSCSFSKRQGTDRTTFSSFSSAASELWSSTNKRSFPSSSRLFSAAAAPYQDYRDAFLTPQKSVRNLKEGLFFLDLKHSLLLGHSSALKPSAQWGLLWIFINIYTFFFCL